MNNDLANVQYTGNRCVIVPATAIAAELGRTLGNSPNTGTVADQFADTIERLINLCASPQSHGYQIEGIQAHVAYYCEVMRRNGLSPVEVWQAHGVVVNEAQAMWLKSYVPEFMSHVSGWLRDRAPKTGAAQQPPITTATAYTLLHERAKQASSSLFRASLPCSVLGLPSEANLSVLLPAFEQSLQVPGDVCEFGCFRGATSLKLAYLIQALGLKKTVYAFDTFEGFQIDDPGGGALGIGAFADNFDAFGELQKWGKVVPLVPVKGDATATCSIIKAPLSFVWLDLDMGVLMEPVLSTIMPYITAETVIGVDDVGRPETPTVEPWIRGIVERGALREVSRHAPEFIRFYRRVV